MPPQSEPLKALLSVLSERAISLDANDVAWAFESRQPAKDMETWTTDYLSPPTCLTKEEEYFERCTQTSRWTTLGSSVPSLRRPFDDHELKSAISSLTASAVALEKQCKAVAAQKSALSVYRTKNCKQHENVHEYSSLEACLLVEKGSLDSMNSGSAGSIQSQLRASEKQIEVGIPGFLAGVDRLLEKDDRLLEELNKLLPRIASVSLPSDEIAFVNGLCQQLNALVAREIRARVDATYQQSVECFTNLHAESKPIDQASEGSRHKDMLKAELDELVCEIDSLATMATESRYKKDLEWLLGHSLTTLKSSCGQDARHMAACLKYLAERLRGITLHVRQMQAYRDAIRTTASASKSSVLYGQSNGHNGGTTHADQAAVSTRGLKPLKLVQQNLSDAQDPTMSLARQLGMPVLHSNTTTSHAQWQHLVKDIQERTMEKTIQSDLHLLASITKALQSASIDAQGLRLACQALDVSPSTRPSISSQYSHRDVGELTTQTQVLADRLRDFETH